MLNLTILPDIFGNDFHSKMDKDALRRLDTYMRAHKIPNNAPSSSLILLAILETCKVIGLEDHIDPVELVNERPELAEMLQETYKAGSFKTIRNLGMHIGPCL